MKRPWMIDELAYAGPEHLDPTFVAGYDTKQGHPSPAEDLEVFVAHGLDSSSIVVDLGAGTGQFAIEAARRFARVIAVDVSPVMLGLLGEKTANESLDNVERIRAGFLTYRHSGSLADGIYTRNALHHLPDFWKALALDRMASFIKPGGLLRIHDLAYDFLPSDTDQVFDRWFDCAVIDSAHGYTTQDFIEHIRTEHSTFRWLFESMLTRAGFDIVDVAFRGSTYGSYTCTRHVA